MEHATVDDHSHGLHFTPNTKLTAFRSSGMWLFLGTEILLFGGTFCGLYAIFRAKFPELCSASSTRELDRYTRYY